MQIVSPSTGVNPFTGFDFFDDLITGNPGALNVPQGPMGMLVVAVAGGSVSPLSNVTQPVVGRQGIWAIDTGTTANATGQSLLYTDAASIYLGSVASATYLCTARVPILSTVTNEFQVELGFRTGFGQTAGNAIAFLYQRTGSTNWQAFTANNGTVTTITTANAAFAVVAGTWYNFKIVINAASVDFYIAPAGTTAYVLLGSSSTNLPNASFPTYLAHTIYKTSSYALRRQCEIDMVRFSGSFASAR